MTNYYNNIRITYPGMESDQIKINLAQNSVSIRDWFAGQALQGLLAADYGGDYNAAAGHAYRQADAMLKARGQ